MPTTSAKPDSELRALTLLRMLQYDVREAVLQSLPANLQSRLREKIGEQTASFPSAKQQLRILNEFEELFTFAVQLAGPKLKLYRDHSSLSHDDEIVELTGDPLVDLEQMNPHQLSAALEEEQPRTVALLLRILTPGRTAQLLAELSPETRTAVVREMSSVVNQFRDDTKNETGKAHTIRLHPTVVPAEVLHKIAGTTVERARQMPAMKRDIVDPVIRLADVLREAEKPLRREYLNAIESEDPDQATALQRHLYRFEDLLDLTDRQVQTVLTKVDSETLQNALQGADEEIIEKILKNLSRRAAANLREELSYQRELSDDEAAMARGSVAAAIADADGESGK